MGGTMVDSIPNQEMPVLGSRLKWTLLSMLSFCTFVCYVFRVNMSIAVITIKDEHHWGAATKGQVLSSFFYGYLLMQFSAKFLTTFIGGKKTLGYGVLIWSTCTLLTTYGPNFGLTGVIICRFTLGLTQALCFPTIYHILGQTISSQDRGIAVALVAVGCHAASTLMFMFGPALMTTYGWEVMFSYASIVGFVWFAAWEILIPDDIDKRTRSTLPTYTQMKVIKRDDIDLPTVSISTSSSSSSSFPASSSSSSSSSSSNATNGSSSDTTTISVNTSAELIDNESAPMILPSPERRSSASASATSAQAAALSLQELSSTSSIALKKTPIALAHHIVHIVLQIVREPSLLVIVLSVYARCHAFYTIFAWLPTYFNDVLHVDVASLGFFSSAPYISMVIFSFVSGYLADTFLSKTLKLRTLHVRRTTQLLGSAPSILFTILFPHIKDPTLATYCCCLSLGFSSIAEAGTKANQLDVVPKAESVVFEGFANTIGALAGVISVSCAGYLQAYFNVGHAHEEHTDDDASAAWVAVFYLSAAVQVLSTVMYMCFSSDKRLVFRS